MNGSPLGNRFSERLVGFAFRHPNRALYVFAEFWRPLPWRQRLFNAKWHLLHWNDLEAYCALYQEAQDA